MLLTSVLIPRNRTNSHIYDKKMDPFIFRDVILETPEMARPLRVSEVIEVSEVSEVVSLGRRRVQSAAVVTRQGRGRVPENPGRAQPSVRRTG